MFEKRPFLFVGGVTPETETPVGFNVLDPEGKEVAQILRDGNKWRVQFKGDYHSGEARFNSSDEAFASLN
jgi:hypothetical protein